MRWDRPFLPTRRYARTTDDAAIAPVRRRRSLPAWDTTPPGAARVRGGRHAGVRRARPDCRGREAAAWFGKRPDPTTGAVSRCRDAHGPLRKWFPSTSVG